MKTEQAAKVFAAMQHQIKSLYMRVDGRVEGLCEHGIGHPLHAAPGIVWQDWMSVHGCDGCCKEWPKVDTSKVDSAD